MGYTKALTCNGTNNLLALMLAANPAYNGPALALNGGALQNMDGTVAAYLFFTDSNVNKPGVRQVETLTCAGTVTVAGNVSLVVTAAALTGTPITINVPVTVGMVAKDIRQAAISSASADPRILAFFDFTHDSKANLIATAKAPAANDSTMDFSISDNTSTGVTTASSANTTAGSLSTTSGMPFGPSPNTPLFALAKNVDLATVWIYTASSITINVAIY